MGSPPIPFVGESDEQTYFNHAGNMTQGGGRRHGRSNTKAGNRDRAALTMRDQQIKHHIPGRFAKEAGKRFIATPAQPIEFINKRDGVSLRRRR